MQINYSVHYMRQAVPIIDQSVKDEGKGQAALCFHSTADSFSPRVFHFLLLKDQVVGIIKQEVFQRSAFQAFPGTCSKTY